MRMMSALSALGACALLWPGAAGARPIVQAVPDVGAVEIPTSSQAAPAGSIARFHTNVRLVRPANGMVPRLRPAASGRPEVAPGTLNSIGETPGTLACAYQQPGTHVGCLSALATGGSGTIAIVDAFDDPYAASDLATYSSAFGLPAPALRVVYAAGARPPVDPTGGWEIEESLDLDAAHALAPNAQLILVEAASDSTTDLLQAVDVASDLVSRAGGGEVSMSWGSPEFAGEQQYEGHFQAPGVVYFAATGDAPGTSWPSVSPHVVAVGGTVIRRDAASHAYAREVAWGLGGGGPSAYFPSPPYQQPVRYRAGASRGVPDIAADAGEASALHIYDSYPYEGTSYAGQLMLVAGTSLATPLAAAITNAAGTFRGSSVAELVSLYGSAGDASFQVVRAGYCGPDQSYRTTVPWSYCTGLGRPLRAGAPAVH